MPAWPIHGFAIVSDDGNIADAQGHFPSILKNDADWATFQTGLDSCRAVVLGRLSHESTPNHRGRLRIVVSGHSPGLERRTDAWWWNPDKTTASDMLRDVVPDGGRIAVPGGRLVFDLFLRHGYDAFHLTRHEGVRLPGGVPVFTLVSDAVRPESILERHGLTPTRRTRLAPNVTVTVWARKGPES